jgi:glycerol-3-phosphate dehydrogenase
VITISSSGLVTIVGGKWTTYRKMAEDTIDQAIPVGNLPRRPSYTSELKLFGYAKGLDPQNPWSAYGSEIKALQKLSRSHPSLKKKLTPDLPYTFAHVQWAVDHEMARSVEDVLSRRTRLLLLDARAALKIAPEVAQFMAYHMNHSKQWENTQISEFTNLAKRYFLV